jgi:hypothetical protein
MEVKKIGHRKPVTYLADHMAPQTEITLSQLEQYLAKAAWIL